MNSQENFTRIAKAIIYLKDNFREQPELESVAESVALSPFHFQRIFTEWAGVSPKKFLQYISLQHAKRNLQHGQSLFETALDTGLSGTGRLHDLFVSVEGMTPGEYKNGGESLTINYNFYSSLFGRIIIASTQKGICHIGFADDEDLALSVLRQVFVNAKLKRATVPLHNQVLPVFSGLSLNKEKIKLHLKGTEFQLKVWETLLKIPEGKLATYGNVASAIGKPTAARAVGTAIGDNPVAYLIPCHRVIQASGVIGNYMWGSERKHAMIGWEGARVGDDIVETHDPETSGT